MNREIKFRGKRINKNEWVIGFYYFRDWENTHWIRVQKDYHFIDVLVDPKTVGQYTGLTDDDGVDIYEGDIVTFTDFRGVYTTRSSIHDGYISGWIGTIEWDDTRGWFLNKKNDHNKGMLKATGNEKQDRSNPYIYENLHIKRIKPKVIGNVYEK